MRIHDISFVCIHKPWICLSMVYTDVYQKFSMCYWQMVSLLIDIKNFRYGLRWWWSYNCIVCNRISYSYFFHMNICSYVQLLLYERMLIWTHAHVSNIWIYTHMNICRISECMNIWTFVHLNNIWTYAHIFICYVCVLVMYNHSYICIYIKLGLSNVFDILYRSLFSLVCSFCFLAYVTTIMSFP